MYGKIICGIVDAFAPEDTELVLTCAVAEPVEAHIYGFGAALFDGAVGNAGGAAVVNLERCGRLRMAHFVKADADGNGIFGIEKGSTSFCFGGR
mgnify:CR=1 FL=1